MHHDNLSDWEHDHTFRQDRKRPGEKRTAIVIAITAIMMVVEIAAGIAYGSMALLADGMHMASHALALGISFFAYIYARRHAKDARFSFGTGKVNALGGFSGAILLALFALLMVWESVERLIFPTAIEFNQAIAVAVLGLLVNGASVFILGDNHHHDEHGHDHDSHHDDHHHHHDHGDHHHHDHNLRSAYLHVLADALTSLTAIVALLAAKFFGWIWMDPLMGIVGSVLVARWSIGLLKQTSGILLDHQASKEKLTHIREAIEADEDARLADLHVWSIGPGLYGVIVSIVAHEPREPDHYKSLLKRESGLAHVTIEVNRCDDNGKIVFAEVA